MSNDKKKKKRWQIYQPIEFDQSKLISVNESARLRGYFALYARKEIWEFVQTKCTDDGWTYDADGNWQKDGVRLLSPAGFQLNRELHMLFKKFVAFRRVAQEINDDTWPLILSAYFAGNIDSEDAAYIDRKKNSGRKTRTQITDSVFSKAFEQWKRGGGSGRPRWREISEHVVWNTDKVNQPSDRRLENLFGIWYRKQSRK